VLVIECVGRAVRDAAGDPNVKLTVERVERVDAICEEALRQSSLEKAAGGQAAYDWPTR
jgi:hypothetical protein